MTLGDGTPCQYRPEAAHIYERPGPYTLKLTVTTGTRHSTYVVDVNIREPEGAAPGQCGPAGAPQRA